MKKVIIYISFVLVVLMGVLAGYYIGRGQYLASKRSEITFTLDALEKIRKDDTSGAISILEGHCYSSAVILLESPTTQNKVILKILIPDLVKYRDRYANRPEQWSKTEQRLEKLLKKSE